MAQPNGNSVENGADEIMLFPSIGVKRKHRASGLSHRDIATSEGSTPVGEGGDEQMEAEVEEHLNASASTSHNARRTNDTNVETGDRHRSALHVNIRGHGKGSELGSISTVAQACENCRVREARCTMSKPDDSKCTRCMTKGLDCTFLSPPPTDTRRKKKRVSTSSLPESSTVPQTIAAESPLSVTNGTVLSESETPAAAALPLADSSRKRGRKSVTPLVSVADKTNPRRKNAFTHITVSRKSRPEEPPAAEPPAAEPPAAEPPAAEPPAAEPPAAELPAAGPPAAPIVTGKRRPGRPRKHPLPDESASVTASATPPPPPPASLPASQQEASPSVPRARGRRPAVHAAVAAVKETRRKSRSASDTSIAADSTSVRGLKSALVSKPETAGQPISPTRTEEGSKIGVNEHLEEEVMPVRSRAELEKELARAQSINERLQKENQIQREQLNRFATIKLERLASILRNSGEDKRDGHTRRRSLNSTSAASQGGTAPARVQQLQSVQEQDRTVVVSHNQVATVIDLLAKAISEAPPAFAFQPAMDLLTQARPKEHESIPAKGGDMEEVHGLIETLQANQNKSIDSLRKAFALAQGLQQPTVESIGEYSGEPDDGNGQVEPMEVDPQHQLSNGHAAAA